MLRILVVGFCLFGSTTWSRKLPSFITQCDANSPDLESCILKEAQRVGPEFARGIPEYGVEPLDPLFVEYVETNTAGLKLENRNLTVKGISKMKLKTLTINTENLTGSIEIFGNISTHSDYEMSGQILILPVKGKGKSIIKLYDLNNHVTFKLKRNKDESGASHFYAYDVKHKYTVKNVKFHMTGLFKGDEQFTRTLNQLMNDNWRELIKDFGGPSIKTITKKIIKIINDFYEKVSFDEMFTGTDTHQWHTS